jgi:hypothetical protein
MLLVEEHPYSVAEEIAGRYGVDLVFTYSRYRIAPPGHQAVAPRSAAFRVAAREVTQEWLGERFAELGPNEEMAWHSLVESGGVSSHIPMIDFIGRPPDSVLRELDRKLTGEMGLNGHLVVFETGRSFHGYFPDLIPGHVWENYLGQLLLINEPALPPVIDARWIGHALVRGFTALRWSHNTNRYRAMPSRLSVSSASRMRQSG